MRAFITAALLAVSTFANAGTSETCDLFGTMAAQAMQVRQSGADLQDMLNRATGNQYVDQTMYKLLRIAYTLPRMPTKKAQREMIQEFKNKAVLECSNDATD